MTAVAPAAARAAPRDVRAIAARATSLTERASAAFVLVGDERQDVRVEARLDRWREVVAKGDATAFDRYLGLAGLNATSARRAVSTVHWPAALPLPQWTTVLERVFAEPRTRNAHEPWLAPDEAAMHRAFAPFLHVAAELLDEVTTALVERPSAQVRRALVRGVLPWIDFLSGPTLSLELELRRARRNPAARAFGEAAPGEADLDALATELTSGGLDRLLTEYAVLARLLCKAVLHWREAAGEFLLRLERDRNAMAAALFAGADLGAIEELRLGLSDPHHGGRQVIAVRFASGRRVVYKPRAPGMDTAYRALLSSLNARGAPIRFRPVALLDCGSHAWVEYVEHVHCRDPEELRQFARSAGAVLCLAHALRATDLHSENLIASGPHAVLVDVESLMHPRVRPSGSDDGADARAHELLRESVLGTALLPMWLHGEEDGTDLEIGGLGALGGWLPHAVEASPVADAGNGRLALDVAPHDLVEELCDGFQRTYTFLLAERADLLADSSPLRAFAGLPIRVIFRDTQIYLRIARRSVEPDALRDGADRGIELECLNRSLRVPGARPELALILRSEVAALAELDIPYLRTVTNEDALTLPDGSRIDRFFDAPGLAAVEERLRAMDADDLSFQLDVIRASFRAQAATPPDTRASGERPPGRQAREAAVEAERGPRTFDPVAEAVAIARELERRAIRGANGTVTWVAPVFWRERNRFRLTAIPAGLRDGRAGVAVFLDACARVAGESRWDALARAARPAEPLVVDPDVAPLPEAALGARLDSLCGGTFGRVEELVARSATDGRAEWRDEAFGIAADAASRAQLEGGYRCLPGVPAGSFVPGLASGYSGIGYALLRLAAPELLPAPPVEG